MITNRQVEEIIAPRIADSELFIIDIDVKPGNKIFVLIDSKQGVSIDQCVEISRLVERSLDRDTDDFELQVSSPGLDQPFRVIQQYEKNLGREVEVIKNDGTKFTGTLKEINEENFIIEVKKRVKVEGKKKKQLQINDLAIQFDEIKATKVVISFK
ncbi:MAG TPA: ribosome assembly cofactor RimP [Bacteroidales bacterium]|nr:ribosome assembly cofactor RimP [Bacteroidales bacterium]